jgi:hypothetical protein
MPTVKELCDYLAELDDNLQVIFAKDEEGNGFSPWAGDHSIGRYTPANTWSGDFESEENFAADIASAIADGFEPEPRFVNAIVLWPTN